MFTEEHKKAERRELLIHFIENHTEGNKIKEDLTLLSDVELKQRTKIIVKALKDNKDTTGSSKPSANGTYKKD